MENNVIVIGGSRWVVTRLTPAKKERFLKEYKMSKAERKETYLRGYCDFERREIALAPGQDSEDEMNTKMHEGLHAIVNEMGSECGISKLNLPEREWVIYRLSAEILGYLKQVGVIPCSK